MKKIIKSEDKLSFTLIRKSVGYVLQNAFISKTALEDYVANTLYKSVDDLKAVDKEKTIYYLESR